MTGSTDLAIPTTDISTYDPSGDVDVSAYDYAELVGAGVISIDGLSDLDKADLLGVPHILTSYTFWTPKITPKETRHFMSVEGMICDRGTLDKQIQRGRVLRHLGYKNNEVVTDINALPYEPEERIVYNDSSTGVRRQIVTILHNIGLINVGQDDDKSGLSRFDKPWTDWAEWDHSQTRKHGDMEVPSFAHHFDHPDKPLLIVAKRGLYVSEYSNDYEDEAVTFYLR